MYDSHSYMACRSQKEAVVSLFKSDIYDERIAYFVIKSSIHKITIKDVE